MKKTYNSFERLTLWFSHLIVFLIVFSSLMLLSGKDYGYFLQRETLLYFQTALPSLLTVSVFLNLIMSIYFGFKKDFKNTFFVVIISAVILTVVTLGLNYKFESEKITDKIVNQMENRINIRN